MFLFDLDALELTTEEEQQLRASLVAGVILFQRNYQNKAQLRALIQQIRSIKPEALIAVDHEGGRVQRFKTDGFTVLPPMAQLGKSYDTDRTLALRQAWAVGYVQAFELVSLGIDLSFAPVLDLDTGLSGIIGNRAFHSNPQIIISLAEQFIEGLRAVGMHAVGKHFPGHGSVRPDSHVALPVDPRPLSEIERTDLVPFVGLLPQLSAVMTAHITYPEVDQWPCTLSHRWLTDYLKTQQAFQGLVFSDDIGCMKALESFGTVVECAQQSFAAGADIILVCNSPDKKRAILQQASLFKCTLEHSALSQKVRANPAHLNERLYRESKQLLEALMPQKENAPHVLSHS